jgi:hypothetical protein
MEDNTIDKKKEEEDVSTIKGGDYQYTPKEGFVLSHYFTVAELNDPQTSSFRRKNYSQWRTHHHPDCQ